MLESLTPLIYPSKSAIGVLEAARGGLAWSLIFSTGVVILGVYLENEAFSKYVQHTGWKILLVGLAAEIFISAELWGVDTGITNRQQEKIFALEKKIAPRDLDSHQRQAIADAIRPFAGMHFDIGMSAEIEPMRLVDKIEAALTLGVSISAEI